MNRRSLHVILAAAVFTAIPLLQTSAAEDGGQQTPGETFLNDWKSSDKPSQKTPPRFEWGESRNGLDTCKLAMERLLSKEQLDANAEMTVKLSPERVPNYKIVSKKCSPADQFKFEQAIWESAPFTGILSRPNGLIVLKGESNKNQNDNEKAFFERHPKLVGEAVLIHVIPRNINAYERFQDTFTSESLEQVQNLRAIKMQKLGSRELQKFRNDWISFTLKWPRSTTRKQILDFAASLLNKYPSLFEG